MRNNNLVLATTLGLVFVTTVGASFHFTSSYASDESFNTNATLTAPVLKDPTGKAIEGPVKLNQMVIITTKLTSTSSSSNSSMPFIIIVEARDELGVTRYSQFGTGSLNLGGNSSSEVGLSWRPEEAGIYELRAFALSDFNSPQILAPVQSSLIDVEQ